MSVGQATIQTKSRVRLERGPAWHRSETRKAILQAAREMIEQDGLEKTSLLRIAETTGFAPPTVYAYFVRKSDLISAIVADDLSIFARTMRDGFPFSPEPEIPEEEIEEDFPVDFAEAEPDESESIPAEEVVLDRAKPVFYAEPEPEHFAPAIEPHRVEAASDTGSAASGDASVEARIAQLEARRVDPWLERRLREFERMLTALDERVGAAPSDAGDTHADSRVQAVIERLEAFEKKQAAAAEAQAKTLTQTIETREAKLRQTQAELRRLTLEASGRLEVLERDRELRAMASELPAVDFTPRRPEPAEVEEEPVAEATEETHDDTATSEESYLAAARRAALTAQSLASADEKSIVEEVSAWIAPGQTRTRVLAGICAALSLVLLGSEFLLHRNATAPHMVRTPVVQTAKLVLPPAKGPHKADFASLTAAALSGNAHAQTEMGLSYLNGTGVVEDDARAAHWLETAATAGEPVAQYWLATLFEHGKGEGTDAAEAVRWYEASALQGNLKAMYKLAVSDAEGWGTRQNYGEAARWFSRAAEYGFVNAQYNLGVLYERGYGVPQSLLDSYKWYALAAAQGDKDSAVRVDALSSQLTPDDLATAKAAVAAFKPLPLDAEANIVPSLSSSKPLATQTAKHTPKS